MPVSFSDQSAEIHLPELRSLECGVFEAHVPLDDGAVQVNHGFREELPEGLIQVKVNDGLIKINLKGDDLTIEDSLDTGKRVPKQERVNALGQPVGELLLLNVGDDYYLVDEKTGINSEASFKKFLSAVAFHARPVESNL